MWRKRRPPKDQPVSVEYNHSGTESTLVTEFFTEDIHHVYHEVPTLDHILIQVNRMHLYPIYFPVVILLLLLFLLL
jgi:hypothetical protein